jgi:hypothetical protein
VKAVVGKEPAIVILPAAIVFGRAVLSNVRSEMKPGSRNFKTEGKKNGEAAFESLI